ncbi:MAG: M23 family metallopeptidase [Chitinophagia bacterium]|nr:M23 family metallopeptidase [Chitinophagia bacterium]
MPFRQGKYLVLQGGRGWPANIMHATGRHAMPYALDIVKLNAAGNRAKKVFSTHLGDYEIFGDTLYSPCSGKIIHATNNNPDNTPPHALRGPTNTNGVVIEGAQFYVCMVHMKYGSVLVKEGDSVKEGQPLGCAGNSGKSIEPHLHIQVHARTVSALPWYRQPPMQISFGGSTYRLFDVISARH